MKNNWVIYLTLIFVFIYHGWIGNDTNVALDFPLTSKPVLNSLFEHPKVWSELYSEGLGQNTVFSLWSWPYSYLTGFLSNLNLPTNFVIKILFLLPILFFSTLSILLISREYKFNSYTSFLLGLFYIGNTYILLLNDGGQTRISVSLSFFPVCYFLFIKSLTCNLRSQIFSILNISFLGLLDFRFLLILGILILLKVSYEFLLMKNKKIMWAFFENSIIQSVFLIGLFSFWIIPFTLGSPTKESFAFLTQTDFTNFNSIGHTILILSPHWFSNVFGKVTNLKPEFLLVPFFVFLAPILVKKNKEVGFWLLIALVGIFLTKGSNPPFNDFYPWAFQNIPGFSVFRDSSKFLFLIVLSYTILMGFSLNVITDRFKKYALLFTVFFTISFLLIINPVWNNQMTGIFSTPYLKDEYIKTNNIFSDDKDFSRTLVIPSNQPLSYSDLNHPLIEALRIVQQRPFNNAAKGSYEKLNFLREASYMGELLDVAGVKYIEYPPLNPKRDDIHPDNKRYYQIFLNQLKNLSWIDSQILESPIPLLKTKEHQDKFFITENTYWVIGSDSIFNESTKSANLKLSKNSLIFAEENIGLISKLNLTDSAKIILNNKTDIDLAASFLNKDKLLFLSDFLTNKPDTKHWWKNDSSQLIEFKEFLKEKYDISYNDFDFNKGWAINEGANIKEINSEIIKKNNVLLSRVLESSKGGEIRFRQDGETIGSIKTSQDATNLRWFEVGKTLTNNKLEIETSGDINVINAMAIVDENDWNQIKESTNRLLSNTQAKFEEKESSGSTAKVVYEKIDSTKYKVTVQNLNTPKMLVFSERYDPRWVLNGKESLPVYGFLNGFYIQKDGEYLIEYEPQKYVLPGLILSGITVVVLLSLFLIRSK